MRYLITGGCGFLGSNLAAEVLRHGDELFLLDNLSRAGSPENLRWIQTQGDCAFHHADIRSAHDVERVVRDSRPDVIFHLAGQVAMTTSIANPRLDFETNVIGGFNVLEAVRALAPNALVTYSSTNKVYGDLDEVTYAETPTRYVTPDFPNGFSESLPLRFESPYGCSKGAVDQYMLDYSRIHDLDTVVFRHSSVYGGRQYSTYDQGWIGWFVRQAIETSREPGRSPFTISGTGKQVRDVLYVSDLTECYFAAVDRRERCAGHAFNIGGGPANSLSLLELLAILEGQLGVALKYEELPSRQSDQRVYVSDITKAGQRLGWRPTISAEEGIRRMIAWVGEYV